MRTKRNLQRKRNAPDECLKENMHDRATRSKRRKEDDLISDINLSKINDCTVEIDTRDVEAVRAYKIREMKNKKAAETCSDNEIRTMSDDVEEQLTDTSTDDHHRRASCPRKETSKEIEVFNFKNKTWMSDITFLVQGKRIYCSKTVLAMFSPVFRTMFSGRNYKQKGTLVELPGKEYESFLDFLKCVFPNVSHPEITKQNVFKILSLAFEYNVGNLLQQCEEYLVKSIELREPCINSLMRILTKAKQYKLNALKDYCIKILLEKDPFAVQASGEKLGLNDTLHFVQGEIILKKHGLLKKARLDLEKTCKAFEMQDIQHAFGGFEQAEAGKLELSLKIDKAEDLNKQTARSEIVSFYGLKFSAQTVIFTTTNVDDDDVVSYLNLYIKCVSDQYRDKDWTCDVRAKCILKMRVPGGRRNEQITKTKTFTFSENHAFFTGLKTKLGPSTGKHAGTLQGREFEAIVYFLANMPKD